MSWRIVGLPQTWIHNDMQKKNQSIFLVLAHGQYELKSWTVWQMRPMTIPLWPQRLWAKLLGSKDDLVFKDVSIMCSSFLSNLFHRCLLLQSTAQFSCRMLYLAWEGTRRPFLWLPVSIQYHVRPCLITFMGRPSSTGEDHQQTRMRWKKKLWQHISWSYLIVDLGILFCEQCYSLAWQFMWRVCEPMQKTWLVCLLS